MLFTNYLDFSFDYEKKELKINNISSNGLQIRLNCPS